MFHPRKPRVIEDGITQTNLITVLFNIMLGYLNVHLEQRKLYWSKISEQIETVLMSQEVDGQQMDTCLFAAELQQQLYKLVIVVL